MWITIILLILFIISFYLDFRQYKNIFLLGLFLISLCAVILFELVIPTMHLSLNINYLLMLNIVYSLIVIVAMLLSLLNLKKKIANDGKFVTNMIVLGYGAFILVNFLILVFKPDIVIKFTNGLLFIYLSILFYYLNLMFITQNIYSWLISGMSKRKKRRYIIVLGAGIIGDKVSPILQARLDKAIKLKKKNLNAIIIVSGGQGPDEIVSEAEAMRNYLVYQGVRAEDIIMEDQSTNTEENLINSYKIMQKEESNPLATIVSNHFHILRASFLAKKLQMNATVTGGSSKYYFYPNAYVREYIAILYMFKKTHIIALIIITILFFGYNMMN